MFATKKRNLKHFLFQLTAMVLIMLLLVSCGGSNPANGNKPENEGKPDVTAKQDDRQNANQEEQQNNQQDVPPKQQQDKVSNGSGPPSTAADSYVAYMEAKGDLVAILTDALANNPGTELYSMSFLGFAMVDLALIPASCFGLGQEAAITALGFLGLDDIEYSESGNQYSVKYRNDKGEQYELHGEYNKAADALTCISKLNGKESLVSEYRKTSFGYVGQTYTIGEDGSIYVYQMAVSGKDGAVGISKAAAAPPALTGSETIDFPRQCQEWYAITGAEVTGLASDGEEISFIYTPPADSE
ncbi:MAG TPA: hypothetical protein GX699_09590 [Firmicutes bacterium]|nr:hypothetical protein [Bacillota bacterium]